MTSLQAPSNQVYSFVPHLSPLSCFPMYKDDDALQKVEDAFVVAASMGKPAFLFACEKLLGIAGNDAYFRMREGVVIRILDILEQAVFLYLGNYSDDQACQVYVCHVFTTIDQKVACHDCQYDIQLRMAAIKLLLQGNYQPPPPPPPPVCVLHAPVPGMPMSISSSLLMSADTPPATPSEDRETRAIEHALLHPSASDLSLAVNTDMDLDVEPPAKTMKPRASRKREPSAPDSEVLLKLRSSARAASKAMRLSQAQAAVTSPSSPAKRGRRRSVNVSAQEHLQVESPKRVGGSRRVVSANLSQDVNLLQPDSPSKRRRVASASVPKSEKENLLEDHPIMGRLTPQPSSP